MNEEFTNNLLSQNVGTRDIPNDKKNQTRCYFCYLAQKHICTLAFVALLVLLDYVMEIITAIMKLFGSEVVDKVTRNTTLAGL